MSNEKVKIGIALAAGLCIGGGVGYLVAERTLRAKTEKEIDGVRDMFNRLREEDAEQARVDWSSQPTEDPDDDGEGYADPDPESLEEETVKLGYAPTVSDFELTPKFYPKPHNYVAPTPKDPEDIREEEEMRIRIVNPNRDNDPNDVTTWERDPNHPYVITDQEFRIDRPEFSKLSLTYYRGDDQLAEADGSFIHDQNGTAGDANLHNYFGLASGDPYLLHVRNERVGADFEITLNEGSYAVEVMGMNIEDQMVKESKRTIKKMRSHE